MRRSTLGTFQEWFSPRQAKAGPKRRSRHLHVEERGTPNMAPRPMATQTYPAYFFKRLKRNH